MPKGLQLAKKNTQFVVASCLVGSSGYRLDFLLRGRSSNSRQRKWKRKSA